MQYICVFAGSKMGNDPTFKQVAHTLGAAIASKGWGLVYGGAQAGLMGAVANGALEQGGQVIGVIPRGLWPMEENHQRLHILYEVENIQERKAWMAQLSAGFIALPGGLGTFDELFEIITWAQLGLHDKPVGILNSNHYFDTFKLMLKQAVQQEFTHSTPSLLRREALLENFVLEDVNPLRLLNRFEQRFAQKDIASQETAHTTPAVQSVA